MRYKAAYRPQFILGTDHSDSTETCRGRDQGNNRDLTGDLDPESESWDPLDGELTEKLNQRRYVSLSRDKRRAASTSISTESIDQNENDTAPPEIPNTVSKSDLKDEEMSLFDIHMPGILTLQQVQALDLDHWLLLVHGTFVHMIVSSLLSFPRSNHAMLFLQEMDGIALEFDL